MSAETVTLRLTVEEFRTLLRALLSPEASDALTNEVLTVSTRPQAGTTLVPLPRARAVELLRLLAQHADDPAVRALWERLRRDYPLLEAADG